jgi:hypothetical protein
MSFTPDTSELDSAIDRLKRAGVSPIPEKRAELSAIFFARAFERARQNPADLRRFGNCVIIGCGLLIEEEVNRARQEMQAEIDCRQREIERLNRELAQPRELF